MAKKNAVLVALIAAVEDLNKVLGFAEPIKTEGATVEALETEIRGVFTEIKPGDKFTPETWEQVKRLGYVTEATPPPPASKKVKAPAAKGEPKANAPAKGKGTPKAEVVKTKFGSREGSQAAEIDNAILSGARKTVEEIAKIAKVPVARVRLHIKFLQTERKITLVEKDGKIGTK